MKLMFELILCGLIGAAAGALLAWGLDEQLKEQTNHVLQSRS